MSVSKKEENLKHWKRYVEIKITFVFYRSLFNTWKSENRSGVSQLVSYIL